MRRRVALAACVFALAAERTSGAHRPSPRFEGEEIPAPPEQESPWTPPETKLPEVLVTAAETLFRQGLADPRGCEYREIEVGTGSCWSGDAGVVRAHGWVLPQTADARRGEKQRFAACWNGLAYPVVSVEDRADLHADVLATVKADQDMRAKQARDRPDRPFYRYRHAVSEPGSVSHSMLSPLMACFLLRLGEEDLAGKVWAAWTAGMRENTNDDSVHLRDPYLMLATEWVWSLFDRAVCAHMRGDDGLALLSARALVPVQKAVETEAERRDFERLAMGREERPHLEFLGQLPDLLADQERRAREPERGRRPSLDELPRDERIAARIEMLDEVAARQWSQPGGVTLGEDPIVQALIEEGDEALEPLLKCLEEDARLTRSVHFGRDFSRHRSIMSAHEAAYVALSGILKTSFFGVASTGDNLTSRGTEGRKEVAARIREYWRKHRGIPFEERWYRTLADDNASPEQWLQAAGNIVMPTNVTVVPGSTVFTCTTTVPLAQGEKPKIRGEVLRERRGPSVAELMARRVDIPSDYGQPGSEREFAMHRACDMALYLARWDVAAALPTLRAQMGRCRDRMAAEKDSESWTVQILGKYFSGLALERARGGDTAALDEHSEWIRTTTPQGLNSYVDDAFRPLWRHPDHPSVAEAVEWLFNDDESPWTPLLRSREEGGSHRLWGLLKTPLVGVEGFRRYLLTELSDRSGAGSATLAEKGYLKVRVDGEWSGGGAWWGGDPLAPEQGTEVAFRRSDLFAWELSGLDGIPMCELYWPEAKRNEAVAACAAFLKRYGNRFKYNEAHRELGRGMRTDRARMTFPRLDRRATADDVQRALAVFSLEGEGETRLWKMPTFPMKAKWVALKDYPRERQCYDTRAGKEIIRLEYEQDGLVWQAEEVLKGGGWERYYGFVGKYVVAKVPAAEIEFPPDFPWKELRGGLDCRVCPPGVSRHTRANLAEQFELGGPFPVSLWLRNRKGVEQDVPSVFCLADPRRGLALLSGMDLSLRYSPETVSPQGTLTPRAEDEKDWRETVPKVAARFAASGELRVLAPAEEIEAFTLDLNDWFEITKPGSYRLKFVFTEDSGLGEGESNEVTFSLAQARMEIQ